MVDFNEIEQHEKSIEYHKKKTYDWWIKYIRNLKMIRNLREENRQLRRRHIVMKETLKDWIDDYFEEKGEFEE